MSGVVAEERRVHRGQGRSGQRAGMTVAVLITPVLVLLPGLLVRSGIPAARTGCALAFFAPMLTYAALSLVSGCHRPELHGPLLTVRTLTGRRTLDLTALRRVRRLFVPGNGDRDWLFLTDDTGVRLRLDRLDGSAARLDEVVRTALGPHVDVSRNAAYRLRPEGHKQHQGCRYLLAPFAGAAAVLVLSVLLLVLSILVAG